MLEYLGELEAAIRVTHAVKSVIAEGHRVTRDINPTSSVSTDDFASAVIERL